MQPALVKYITGRPAPAKKQCSTVLGRQLTPSSLLSAHAVLHVQVVMEALDKPRNIQSKGSIGDIVTDTGRKQATWYLPTSRVAC
jgi:hypothetical protein